MKDLANGAEGITGGGDLKVAPLSTPGAGVQVGEGSGIVLGRVSAFQGAYAVRNQGSDTVPIAATGASARSDMVIVRVEDPEYEGNLDPAVDDINYFQVISGVSSSATAIPDGRTGIALARIDIPASTSTITSAMITDLRKIANPRRERIIQTESPLTDLRKIANPSISTALGGSTDYKYFSTALGKNFAIPAWASKAIVKIDVSPLRYDTANFWGYLSATFGDSLTVQATTLDDNQGSGVRRVPAVIADTLTIPDAYRGTSQLLRVRTRAAASGQTANIYVDSGTTLVYDVQYVEAPR
ncbi:hypothetical protein SUDANB145_07192 (plasmid) [Streptomyces sp. enrichment culture]|uniref:hypothetical protein n=1 Tax=Streptomyces sp. enrichment culture TaxID=1795815 RepID=UPI003F563D80